MVSRAVKFSPAFWECSPPTMGTALSKGSHDLNFMQITGQKLYESKHT